jgi:hypothetical protein
VFVSSLALYLFRAFVACDWASGDEPPSDHFRPADGDLRIENNHQRGDAAVLAAT